MKKLLVLMALIFSSSNVLSEEIFCTISINAKEELTTIFKIEPKNKMAFAEISGFKFFLSHLSNARFELDIFNPNDPSRSYAQGFLRTTDDSLGWSFWSRDILLETTCKLNQK